MNDEMAGRIGAIEGVSQVELGEGAGGRLNVRVRLVSGADQEAVAARLQELFRAYGLRSHVAPPRAKTEPSAAPAPPQPFNGRRSQQAPEPATQPAPPVPSGPAWVAVEEGDGRASVTAGDSTGRRVEVKARPTPDGLAEAIAEAVALLSGRGRPKVLAVRQHEVEGRGAVTVVLERADGSTRAGAALVEVGWAYAVARAVWSALG